MNKEIVETVDTDTKKKKKQHNMLLANGITHANNNSSTDLKMLDAFLENEKQIKKEEPWSKLDKTDKLKKLITYADKYKTDNNLTEEEHNKLLVFFKDCLDRKKLQRVKDVSYDKETGKIKDIPALTFAKLNTHFTLKNIDKRVSTIKSLTPKKNNTLKNKDNEDEDEI
jgi:hypothetical protein